MFVFVRGFKYKLIYWGFRNESWGFRVVEEEERGGRGVVRIRINVCVYRYGFGTGGGRKVVLLLFLFRIILYF